MVIYALFRCCLRRCVIAKLWLSGHVPGFAPTRSHDEVPLTSVSSNERLRRVILYAYVNCFAPSSAEEFTLINNGLLSLIQWTSGPIPPTPDPVTDGVFNNRDILHSQMHQLGPSSVRTDMNTFPAPPGLIEVDITPLRGDGIDPGIVWWVWGIPQWTGTDPAYCRATWWFRILLETVP